METTITSTYNNIQTLVKEIVVAKPKMFSITEASINILELSL